MYSFLFLAGKSRYEISTLVLPKINDVVGECERMNPFIDIYICGCFHIFKCDKFG